MKFLNQSKLTTQEILNTVSHRSRQIPDTKWKFYQEWNNALFMHWKVDLDELKKLVPKELEIDLFEGIPWVSVVSFTMEKIRPRNLPSFPPISDFHEINIRTYVKSNNKPGVYFLSIEGGSRISCKLANSISELPYRYSKMNRDDNLYKSINERFGDSLMIDYSVGKELANKSALDKWLTERYFLFQDTQKSVNQFEIHHVEWPIKELLLKNMKFQYPRFDKLINSTPDLTQYSEGVQVVAWGKNRL